jgi:CheY-like chemotaxis protein
MNETTLARAIEPFFTTKGIGKGTGLGLPMVHGLAEQSNGKFALASEQGKGTTAELWLPVSTEAADAGSRGPKAARPAATKPLRILAVDDDALVLANTATMLQELGHSVREAESGHQALKILRNDELDLVVTDFAMPGMTGEELATTVREEFPGLPILMVSGYADLAPGVASNTLRLAKPFDEAALAAAIARVVGSNLSAGGNQVN